MRIERTEKRTVKGDGPEHAVSVSVCSTILVRTHGTERL